jgi:ATP-dependent DNA helicase RecG
VTDYLEQWVEAKPNELRDLLLTKLSDGLTEQQKRNKIRNLLTSMRKEGRIVAIGIKRSARWRLPFNYGPAPAKPIANEG